MKFIFLLFLFVLQPSFAVDIKKEFTGTVKIGEANLIAFKDGKRHVYPPGTYDVILYATYDNQSLNVESTKTKRILYFVDSGATFDLRPARVMKYWSNKYLDNGGFKASYGELVEKKHYETKDILSCKGTEEATCYFNPIYAPLQREYCYDNDDIIKRVSWKRDRSGNDFRSVECCPKSISFEGTRELGILTKVYSEVLIDRFPDYLYVYVQDPSKQTPDMATLHLNVRRGSFTEVKKILSSCLKN